MSEKKQRDVTVPGYARFIIGGLSGMGATLFVQPLDLVKFRMQLSGEGGATRDYNNSFQAIRWIVKKEGILGLYQGLSANLLRQGIFATTRMGVYQVTIDHFKKLGYEGFLIQVLGGNLGGLIGAVASTPTDVALVRMAADGRLPLPERRNYKNVFEALFRIAKEEGRKGLYAGLEPTVLRAMVGNTAQLVSYSQAKQFVLAGGYLEDNILCHFVCSLFSGFAYSSISCPLDVAKTRMQYMRTETGTPLYSNIWDALRKTVQAEGISALWKGFGPLYVRACPHTILLFIFSERLTLLLKQHLAKSKKKSDENEPEK